jgi:predicted transcriptional regulator
MRKKMTPELETEIMNYFLNNKNNSTRELVSRFGWSENTINKVIDRYFLNKVKNKSHFTHDKITIQKRNS